MNPSYTPPNPVPGGTVVIDAIPPTTRADVEAVAAKLIDLSASGDGVEAGFTTTEFWLTVIAVGADFAGPYLGVTIPDNERMLIAAGLVMAYGAFRTWRKNSGPAQLSAAVLGDFAAVRKAMYGS